MQELAQSFQSAERWIKRCARPLEAARWEYAFREGPADRVVDILTAYQNSDGGFGHGLEPDFWLPDSSPMASWAASRILREVEAGPAVPTVQSLVEYLCQTQGEDGLWPAVMPATREYPHAPWHEWTEGAKEQWMFNPSVELAACLVHWSQPGSRAAAQGWQTIQLAATRLVGCDVMDMHEISNYIAVAELMAGREAEFRQQTGYGLAEIQQKLADLAVAAVDPDVSKWAQGYRALPLTFVQGPDSFLCAAFGDLVQENLAFYAEQADENGLWPVTWEWAAYPNEFAAAKRWWQGIIALERYQALRAFGWL
ncbi:MAG: hypothetical protein GX195_04565 [Firmicutes bacterium]|jgi:hypothetical protein|nr:hypothetical protein [Bacillota bacterium]